MIHDPSSLASLLVLSVLWSSNNPPLPIHVPPAVQTMNNDCYLNQVDIYITLKECENLTQIRNFPCSKQPLNLL